MSSPWPQTPPTNRDRNRYADATPAPYWLDKLPQREPAPPLAGQTQADLAIVGAGFTGLWTALHAKHDDPTRDVVLLDADTVGSSASGRNGGFVDASLTHGPENGLARFADELAVLERLGRESYAGLRADLERLGIACDFEEVGSIGVALEPHEEAGLEADARMLRELGHDVELLDGPAMRAEVASPTYRGGLWDRTGSAIVDPGRLARGLLDAALAAGVRVHEHSAVRGLRDHRAGTGSRDRARVAGRRAHASDAVDVLCDAGVVRARRVVLATSAHRPLLREIRRYVAPVYDYVLVTEPLRPDQRDAIGWRRRQGLSDMGNQFHYYRLTADDRILFGGYDAVYRYGGPVNASRDEHDATFAKLSQHFATTFPQLEDVRFAYRWGGAIDTCSRFSVFFGTAHRGRVAYAAGYTGLGVAASRFGARVALDLVDGRATEATRLRYVRSRPFPFPPEPLRSAVIQLTRNRLAAADRNEGQRGLWLRTLDRLGLGFDS